jgi:hypothetical protein
LKFEELKDKISFTSDGSWIRLNKPLENLSGEFFLVSGTGKYFRTHRYCGKSGRNIY